MVVPGAGSAGLIGGMVDSGSSRSSPSSSSSSSSESSEPAGGAVALTAVGAGAADGVPPKEFIDERMTEWHKQAHNQDDANRPGG